ncbi:hypothetical protein LTR36_004903 [Oleoguttula mirabilis]|uniref:Uncharacterized protein n=1 Tax=Oleoguttula mirabilis TaxID=1507867 RepID=A0AAV9JWZ0_9PEZI|nr:hypothetical protein LTR36_004903 [Oleoguttula mirabilis]
MGIFAIPSDKALPPDEPAASGDSSTGLWRAEHNAIGPALDYDVLLPADSLDIPWEMLWDTFEETGAIGTWSHDYGQL